MRKTIVVSTWHYLILSAVLWMSLASGLIRLYDWWTIDRPLHNCVRDHVYRCDIGETRIFITYRNGQDVGPDE